MLNCCENKTHCMQCFSTMSEMLLLQTIHACMRVYIYCFGLVFFASPASDLRCEIPCSRLRVHQTLRKPSTVTVSKTQLAFVQEGCQHTATVDRLHNVCVEQCFCFFYAYTYTYLYIFIFGQVAEGATAYE